METPVLHERRRLNEEIERAFIATAGYSITIQRYNQTQRGIGIIDLYENFYESFAYLVMLTCDLEQLRQYQENVETAKRWLDQKINIEKDAQIQSRLESGIKTFIEYKKVLSEQGVITLPHSGR